MSQRFLSLTIVALTIASIQTTLSATLSVTKPTSRSSQFAYTEQSGPFRVNISSLDRPFESIV
jgi:predicted solute-binding protein